MFTECPECSIAFRVTPQVLKQAGGRVRCGGCGNAFSAIDHLTEEPPGANNNVDSAAGEDSQSDNQFAETSKQLLETLDELAGPDEVRIEDTGIEWRVLEDIEGVATGAEIGQQDKVVAADAAPSGGASEHVDSADAEASQELLDLDEPEQIPLEEQRYDDNTPLPEEFDDEEEYQYTPPLPKRRADDHDERDTAEFDEKQADLALSEPEDWTDLLDEVVDEGAATGNIPLEVEEELAAIHSELSTKDAPAPIEPEDNSVPADIDSQFEMQAEAMGIDISGIHETAEQQSDDDAMLVDDPAEDDLTDEVPLLDDLDEGIATEIELTDATPDVATDDAQTEAVAIGDDLELAEEVEAMAKTAKADLESTGEFEAKIDIAEKALENEGFEDDEKDEHNEEMTLDDVIELSLERDDEAAVEVEEDEDQTDIAFKADPADAAVTDPENDDTDLTATGSAPDDAEESTATDQKMDFAATLVGIDDPSKLFDEDSGEVETIIMEGEFIHDSKETARLHAENEARKRFKDANSLVDTYAANRGVRGGRRKTDPAGYGVIAGTVLLGLLLVGQLLHAYRQSLSTYGFFNQTIGPVYRMLGNPVTPAWDIKGWQFEATNGSVAEQSELLTIVSRIGNTSQQPLPYPLVHVSLTDRYEEIIGSRVLEPNEYLAGDLDPSKPVVFGENFTAVITIDEPSVDATGFKLNVCYRVNPTQLRCAIEDFKN